MSAITGIPYNIKVVGNVITNPKMILSGEIKINEPFRVKGNITPSIPAEKYDGPYEVTPTREVITLPTAKLLMKDNVTINPIPKNYGLITWNGAVLTVS